MTTLTGQRTFARRAHLRLVSSNDQPTQAPSPVLAASDPEPGPRDVADLIARFAGILPGDDACDGLFSLGSL
jgi:hypothetical protein